MADSLSLPSGATTDNERTINEALSALERRDWWHVIYVVFVILFLAGAVAALTLPGVLTEDGPVSQLSPISPAQGLLVLTLIFNGYILYQHHAIQKLRGFLLDQARISAEQRSRADALYELAILDPLTGLYNRRFGEEYMQAEMSRATRHGLPLALVVLDLNDFKQVNDSHGHVAGDLLLKEFAHRLKKATRGSDIAVRLGGDEFLVVLPECPPERVGTVLSRLKDFDLEVDGKQIHVSSSRGCAQFELGDTIESLLQRADHDLYAQKTASLP